MCKLSVSMRIGPKISRNKIHEKFTKCMLLKAVKKTKYCNVKATDWSLGKKSQYRKEEPGNLPIQ